MSRVTNGKRKNTMVEQLEAPQYTTLATLILTVQFGVTSTAWGILGWLQHPQS